MIIEDELPAIKVLESHISHFKDLEVCGVYHNAMEALTALQHKKPDLLFLDIQLPKMNGIQFLHAVPGRPLVILTTAHREFALEGYELEITDYLLKPISLERFTRAITRAYRLTTTRLEATHPPGNRMELSDPFIYVKSDREYRKIPLKDILYIESIRNHVKIVTVHDTLVTLLGISEIGQKLPPEFFRVHRSYIVSGEHIIKFTHSYVFIGRKAIPIGKHYKLNFLNWVRRNMV